MPNTAEQYLSLPYTKTVQRDRDENIFVARVRELPGCSAHGDTELEAIGNLNENMRVWIEDCIDAQAHVPLPDKDPDLPSGKWLQRVPRTLHLKLNQLARREGVSLNQLVTSIIAEAVGKKNADATSLLSCTETRNTYWSFADVRIPKDAFANQGCKFYIDNNVCESSSSHVSAVFVQHLADTLGSVASNVTRKERIMYGQRPSPTVTVGS